MLHSRYSPALAGDAQVPWRAALGVGLAAILVVGDALQAGIQTGFTLSATERAQEQQGIGAAMHNPVQAATPNPGCTGAACAHSGTGACHGGARLVPEACAAAAVGLLEAAKLGRRDALRGAGGAGTGGREQADLGKGMAKLWQEQQQRILAGAATAYCVLAGRPRSVFRGLSAPAPASGPKALLTFWHEPRALAAVSFWQNLELQQSAFLPQPNLVTATHCRQGQGRAAVRNA